MLKSLLLVLVCQLCSVQALGNANDDRLLFESNKKIEGNRLGSLKVSSIKEAGRLGVSGQEPNDVGHATNCGNVTHNFSLTWQPKKVNPSRGVQFSLDIIAPMDYNSGTVEVSVYTGGSTQPFITDSMQILCIFIKSKFPSVKCPIKKGDHINLKYKLSDLTALPPGSYTLKADIKVEKEDFICARMDVVISQ